MASASQASSTPNPVGPAECIEAVMKQQAASAADAKAAYERQTTLWPRAKQCLVVGVPFWAEPPAIELSYRLSHPISIR